MVANVRSRLERLIQICRRNLLWTAGRGANDDVNTVLDKEHLRSAAHSAGNDHVDVLLAQPLR